MIEGEDNGAQSADLPSIEDCVPDEQGGPTARAGFTYQDYIAAKLLLDTVNDEGVEQIHCETMDDIVIVRRSMDSSPRTVEYVQVKTTTTDSLWSCSRLCGSSKGENGTSVFEKSLSRDRTKEQAFFRIVTLQAVHSSLRPLTFDRGNPARALNTTEMITLRAEIDARCPGAQSAKGTSSADWLERTLWVESPRQEFLHQSLLLQIIAQSSADGGTPLISDQAEKILGKLLAWVRQAGDAKFVPDKDKKIVTRSSVEQWWQKCLQDERSGATVPSGQKLRKKLTSDVASHDMLENALEHRRQYSEEIRTPKYMAKSDIEVLAMDIRSRLMVLRMQRFTGQNQESPKDFHKRCVDAVQSAANEKADCGSVSKAMAIGCLYDIVDRCQLDFGGDAP